MGDSKQLVSSAGDTPQADINWVHLASSRPSSWLAETGSLWKRRQPRASLKFEAELHRVPARLAWLLADDDASGASLDLAGPIARPSRHRPRFGSLVSKLASPAATAG